MAKQVQLTTQTPLRLQSPVCAAFIKQYRAMIEENGASFALNLVLADLLRKQGHKLNPLETPLQRIASAQKRRWKSAKREQQAEAAKIADRKRKDRERKQRARNITKQATGE